jgi:hypothetical protein
MGRYVLLFVDYPVSLVRTPSSKFKVVKTEFELGLILDPVLVLEPKLEFFKNNFVLEKKVLNHGQPEVNVSSRLRYPELDQNGV